MPRPKEFDEKKALVAAVDAFWNSGFEKTSLEDLMAKMKLGRQSLYDTFGNKRSLYLLALEEYRATTQAAARDVFDSGLGVRECFKAILYRIADSSKSELERGCMLTNANVERAKDDKVLAALIKRNSMEVRQLFATALRSAQCFGEIDSDIDAAAVSDFMFATVNGMRNVGRSIGDRKTLRNIADVALSTLD